MTETVKQPAEPERISLKQFYEETPPGRSVLVKNVFVTKLSQYEDSHEIIFPVIQLYCETDGCDGFRFFHSDDYDYGKRKERRDHFVTYVCRNCGKTKKIYAFSSVFDKKGIDATLYKFGEDPPFGPHTPARVISLIGPEREYYLKGRRAESQGLGIAAFAYYRRVVENQKNRIFDEIIRVAEKIGAKSEIIEDFMAAKAEVQFSKAVGVIKHGIPQALLINGHNPLSLLHSALSEGLHAQTDDQCLELATSIRVVLTDLVDRLAGALKEEATLNAAVSRLLNTNAPSSEGLDSDG